jgi:hypothetical protein
MKTYLFIRNLIKLIFSPISFPFILYRNHKAKQWRKIAKVGDKCFYFDQYGFKLKGKILDFHNDNSVWIEIPNRGYYSTTKDRELIAISNLYPLKSLSTKLRSNSSNNYSSPYYPSCDSYDSSDFSDSNDE